MDTSDSGFSDGGLSIMNERTDTSRDKYILAPIDDVEPNPYQYREDWGDLPGLAKSIEKNGVITTPIGRPNPGTRGKPYQLAAGERRLRASKLAGLTHIPIVIRPMGDDEMIEVLFQENLNRKDTTPLEEARGFKAALDRAYSVEQLMSKTGRSRGYIYGRLKLLELAPGATKALQSGELPVAHAELIARISDRDAQDRCTKEVLGKIDNELRDELARIGIEHESLAKPDATSADLSGFPPRAPQLLSFRATKDLIRRRYMTRLATASFDPNDATLLPSTGACTPCPHRAANQPALPGLVEAGKGDDFCTRASCFESKTQAAFKREAARAADRGVKVLAGANDTRLVFGYNATDVAGGSPYVDPHDKMPSDLARAGSSQSWGKALGRKMADVPRVLVQDGTGAPRELLDRDAAVEVLRGLGKIDKPLKPENTAPATKPKTSKAKADELEQQEIEASAFSNILGIVAVRSEPKNLKVDLAHWRWMTLTLFDYMSPADELEIVADRRGLRDAAALRKVIAKASTVVELRSIHMELLMATLLEITLEKIGSGHQQQDFEAGTKLFGTSWDKAVHIAKGQAHVDAEVEKIKKESAERRASAKVEAAKAAPKKAKGTLARLRESTKKLAAEPTRVACDAVSIQDPDYVCVLDKDHKGPHESERVPGGAMAMWSVKDGRERGKRAEVNVLGKRLKQSGGWSCFADDQEAEKKLDKGLAAIAGKAKKKPDNKSATVRELETFAERAYCPECHATAGSSCTVASGQRAPRPHAARIARAKAHDAPPDPKAAFGYDPFEAAEKMCRAKRKDGATCTLDKGHDGPHHNSASNVSWVHAVRPMDGKDCGAIPSKGGDPCIHDLDHEGVHSNGRITWSDRKPKKKGDR